MIIKKKILTDICLNILATALPIFVVQFLVLPELARYMEANEYGFLVTVLALFNVLPATIGNVLNNIRLLYNEQYEEKNKNGDFQILLLLLTIVSIIGMLFFLYIYKRDINIASVFLLIILNIVWLIREYYLVEFRIYINYTSILLCNLFLIIGYLVGYLVYIMTSNWLWIYIIGYLMSNAYIFYKGSLWKESFNLTDTFQKITVETGFLLIANLLNRLMLYADKLIIYPILGGYYVAIYYTATLFGKVISLMINPINSVFLTYISKWNKKKDDVFKNAVIAGGIACIVGYIICIFISESILNVLYPQYTDSAMIYIPITTATAALYAMISIINPFIIKFFDLKHQFRLNFITALIYIFLCIILLDFYGLYGFCIGALITNFLKITIMIFIYYYIQPSINN